MKNRAFISLLALLLCVCAVFVACTKKKYDFSMECGAYVDHRANIKYIAAPACYEPIEMSEEIYGEMDKVKFFTIVGADPTKWLCEELGNVFYAEGVNLPKLSEMSIGSADVFDAQKPITNTAGEEIPFTTIVDADMLAAIVDAYENGENVTRPVWTEKSFDVNWRIKLDDDTLGIRYVLTFIVMKENYVEVTNGGEQIDHGTRFLYNRFENKLIPVGSLLDEYVEEFGGIIEDAEE